MSERIFLFSQYGRPAKHSGISAKRTEDEPGNGRLPAGESSDHDTSKVPGPHAHHVSQISLLGLRRLDGVKLCLNVKHCADAGTDHVTVKH